MLVDHDQTRTYMAPKSLGTISHKDLKSVTGGEIIVGDIDSGRPAMLYRQGKSYYCPSGRDSCFPASRPPSR